MIFGWPNGSTVWALLITLLAIAEQSVATTKQAELARQAIILQYRPMIRIRAIMISEKDNVLDVHIVIVNNGGTPAHITDGGSVTLDWLWVHSEKSHIITVPIGKLSLSAGAVVTMSIPMTNERLMHSIAKDESRKLNPGMRLRCTGAFIYTDDNHISRSVAFSRIRDEVTETWTVDTNPEYEYAD